MGTWVACSAATGDKTGTNGLGTSGTGGGSSGSSNDASLGGSSANGGTNNGGSGNFSFGNNGGGGTTDMPDACVSIPKQPEILIQYHDATVTDTIITYSPIALFIMMDESGSMVTGFPAPASPDSWANSTNAITAFVNDPASAGINIGLGTFPYGPNHTADCAGGTDCGTPVVPINPLPQNAQPMINGMTSEAPDPNTLDAFVLTPTECGLRGMINECEAYMQQTGIQCVAIMVTDGTPTQCDPNNLYDAAYRQTLVQIVADGYANGVTTFTLGLPGSDAAFLNELAQAGGTTQSIDVTQGVQAFINALNSIRDAVATTSSMQVVTQTVLTTPIDCEWKLPPEDPANPFDPLKVNVTFASDPNAQPVQFGHVPSAADCAQVTQDQPAWYYDNNDNPTEVFVCPSTCDVIKASTTGIVNLALGCPTVDIHIN